MDGAALDRPGADDRDLDGQVLDVLGPRARQHLHLGAALDLEDAGRLGGADPPVDLGVVERDPREIDPLVADPGDLVDGPLDGGEHPEAEQVDLQEAGIGARVLVPLRDLPARHRRRHDRAEVGQRPRRQHHPAGMLGGMAGQSVGVVEQLPQRLLPRRSALDLRLLVMAGRARRPLDLSRRQPEHLAEVADRALRPVGGEGGDQRRAIGTVALVDPRDQPLADVAREVEVDVGRLGDLLVQEAAEEQAGPDRIDVREAGQVTDDRADARAAAAARGEQRSGAVGAADLDRDLAGELEQVAVEQEEAGELQSRDQAQLLLEPPLGLGPLRPAVVALAEPGPAGLGELAVGASVLGSGVAVAEVGGEVEAEPLGEPRGLGDRLGVLAEARRRPLRGDQRRRAVAAPFRLGRLQGPAEPDGDQRVLQRDPVAIVGVDVAGRHAGHPEQRRELAEPAVAGAIAAPERHLQLDAEAIAAECCEQRPAELLGAAPIAAGDPSRQRSVAGATRQADEPLGVPLDVAHRDERGQGEALAAGPGVGEGEQSAEVAVADRIDDEQGQVEGAGRAVAAEAGLGRSRGSAAAGHRQLGAGDRSDPLGMTGAGELHRSPDAVVVGQRQLPVAELGGAQRELVGARGPVQEREGGMGVELDVAHRCSYQRPVSRSR